MQETAVINDGVDLNVDDLYHWFPGGPFIGNTALCGTVKTTDRTGGKPSGTSDICIVCESMANEL